MEAMLSKARDLQAESAQTHLLGRKREQLERTMHQATSTAEQSGYALRHLEREKKRKKTAGLALDILSAMQHMNARAAGTHQATSTADQNGRQIERLNLLTCELGIPER